MKPWLIALLAGLALFATGYWLGSRGSAHLRDAYADSVRQNQEAAHLADSLAGVLRAADSARVESAALAAGRAQGRAQASGRALPGQLPNLDTVTVLDSAGVVALRGELAAFGVRLASHLRDDSLAADSVSRLILTLREATSHALAEASAARLERDRVNRQLAGATKHLWSPHPIWVDMAIAGAGFVVGHLR